MTNDTVFIGGGGLKTLNDQIHENDRRLADQALALAKGELPLAKTERNSSSLSCCYTRNVRPNWQQKLKADRLEEVSQLRAAHEQTVIDLDNQVAMLGRELNALETRFRCGVCYDTFGDDLVCLEMCGHVFCRRCTDREARLDEEGDKRVRCFYCTGRSNSRYFKIFI